MVLVLCVARLFHNSHAEPYSNRVFVFDVVDIQLLRCLDLLFQTHV